MTALPVLEPVAAYALWAASYPAHAHNPVMLAEERAMLGMLPAMLRGLTVLDAGCGSGRYIRHAVQRGAQRVVGVDVSPAMLARARHTPGVVANDDRVTLAEGSVTALPLADHAADVVISGLVAGHVPSLDALLAEFARVCRPGGVILCSDVHPTGQALGWQRDFKADGRHLAVRHTVHLASHWHAACRQHGLAIDDMAEPMLDPADVAAGARFDRIALEIPVAVVYRLRCLP